MASDLSFSIIALDRASKVFQEASVSVETFANRLNAIDGKNVTANVNVKTDESRKALDSFDTRFKMMAAGVIAASPLAGAAIAAGIGAGFVTVAAMAQKSNADVQRTYTNLWSNVVGQTKAATAQVVPQLVAAGNSINATMVRLGPQIQQAFSMAGPDVTALTRGVTDFASNAMPGVASAMSNSLPVFSGVADASGTVGSAFGSMAQSVGQNAQTYGNVVRSAGDITSSALGAVMTIVDDVATAWSQNSAEIDSAIGGTAQTISGLANGALPILSSALDVAATSLKVITDITGPLAPLLGTLGTTALATWGAFKVAGGISAGITALGTGVANLGANVQVGAAKVGTFIAAEQGMAVSSSAAATAVKAAGVSASTAATGFGLAATAIAGPLSTILVVGAGLWAVFGSAMDSNTNSTHDLSKGLDGVTASLEASNGAVTAGVVKSVQAADGFKEAADAVKQYGISQEDLIGSVTKGGSALDDQRAKLQAIIDANHRMTTVAGGTQLDTGLNDTGEKAKSALDALNNLAGGYTASQKAAADSQKAVAAHATELTMSNEGQAAATYIARAFGVSVSSVGLAFDDIVKKGGDAAVTVQDVAASFASGQLKIAGAKAAISKSFQTADAAVVSAQAAVTDATHSYQSSVRSVADAQHSAAQAALGVTQAEQGVADAQHSVAAAQRGIQDAVEGVSNARKSYSKSLEDEKRAEADVHVARQQAIQDLKDLHLQLEDQVVSEESARVRLFESQQNAAQFGITSANVKSVAAEPVSYNNIDRVKAAIDLQSAQNTLNNSLNSGDKVRRDVTQADRAGVEGSKAVTAAQDQLRSAQDQVASSAKGVEKAQQSLADANYGLQQANRGLVRAHQAVADAGYAEQRAHQAVTDAQYASERSAGQLQKAKETLTLAEGDASRALDNTTEAGRRNLAQLLALREQINSQNIPEQDKFNQLVNDTATAFGVSQQAASDMLKQYQLIPQDFKFNVTGVATIDSNNLWSSVSVPSTLTGPSKYFADGGPVSGPGGPRDDKIPAWLSNREYVQPVDSVDYYGIDFMDSVRSKRFPRFAEGGLAVTNAALAGVGSAYQAKTHAQIVMGLPHGPLLPKYVPPPVSQYGGGSNGVIPSGQHLAMIDAALAADGIPTADWPRWEAGMNVLITRESGWNAGIVNNWDSNAAKGTPSGGLTQTIGPTFASNRNPSLPNNMFDPVANIAASINYIRRRYGDISRVQQANPNMPPRGYAAGGLVYGNSKPKAYDNGGELPPGLSAVYNGTGKPENVRTSAQEDSLLLAMKSIEKAIYRAINSPGRGGQVLLDGKTLAGEFRYIVKDEFSRLEHNAGF